MTFFSIITCTKNSSKYLKETINSVKNQSFTDYEHIFIDGNSNDGTKEIILEYQKTNPSKIKLIQAEPKGIANAMNTGINNSNGEYLIHLHSDDYFYDNDVLADVNFFLQNNNLDWIYGKEKRIYTDGKNDDITGVSKSNKHYSSNNRLSKYILKYKLFIPHQASFISKQTFLKFGYFDESLRCPMDYELFLRIRNHTNWAFIDRTIDIFVNRGNNQSLDPNNIFENSVETLIVLIKYMNRLEILLRYLFDPKIKTIGDLKYQYLVYKEAIRRQKLSL